MKVDLPDGGYFVGVFPSLKGGKDLAFVAHVFNGEVAMTPVYNVKEHIEDRLSIEPRVYHRTDTWREYLKNFEAARNLSVAELLRLEIERCVKMKKLEDGWYGVKGDKIGDGKCQYLIGAGDSAFHSSRYHYFAYVQGGQILSMIPVSHDGAKSSQEEFSRKYAAYQNAGTGYGQAYISNFEKLSGLKVIDMLDVPEQSSLAKPVMIATTAALALGLLGKIRKNKQQRLIEEQRKAEQKA